MVCNLLRSPTLRQVKLTINREMAVGNTFGATALSSYGGFWLSLAIVLTPGGFEIGDAYKAETSGVNDFQNAFGFFLLGWWIFTTLLLICTLRSTVAFFLLFFFLDLAFLLLAISHLMPTAGKPNIPCEKAGGVFGLLAAFAAWYNALAGIADDRCVSGVLFDCLSLWKTQLTQSFTSNSFFVVPVAHFPWSVKGRERRAPKTERETV